MQAPKTEAMLLSAREAARYLGRPERWVYRAAQAGWIPTRRCGRSVLFSRVELMRWLEGQTDGNEKPPAVGQTDGRQLMGELDGESSKTATAAQEFRRTV